MYKKPSFSPSGAIRNFLKDAVKQSDNFICLYTTIPSLRKADKGFESRIPLGFHQKGLKKQNGRKADWIEKSLRSVSQMRLLCRTHFPAEGLYLQELI